MADEITAETLNAQQTANATATPPVDAPVQPATPVVTLPVENPNVAAQTPVPAVDVTPPVQPVAPVVPPVDTQAPVGANAAPVDDMPAEPAQGAAFSPTAPIEAPKGQREVLAPNNPDLPGAHPNNPVVHNDAYYREFAEQKRNKMKAILEAEPKVTTMVPLKPGEPENSWEFVQINGYEIHIKKNVFVEVPKTVADILKDSYNLTYMVGKEFEIGANKERKDALS